MPLAVECPSRVAKTTGTVLVFAAQQFAAGLGSHEDFLIGEM